MDLDYSRVSREIVRSLRGKKSQQQLSQMMSYDFNIVTKWERGVTQVSWLNFCEIIQAANRNYFEILQKKLHYKDDLTNYSKLMNHLLSNEDRAALSKKMAVSLSTISAWTNGTCPPKLSIVLFLLDHKALLLPIVEAFFPETGLSSLNSRIYARRELRDYFFKFPEVMGIFIYLKDGCPTIEEVTSWSLRHLNMDENTVSVHIDWLVENDFVVKNAEMFNVTSKAVHAAMDTGGGSDKDFLANLKIKKFWLERSLSHLDNYKELQPVIGYMTFSLSESSEEKIKKMCIQFFQDVARIIQDEEIGKDLEKKKHVSCLNMQFIRQF